MAFGPTQHQTNGTANNARAASPTIKALWGSEPAGLQKVDGPIDKEASGFNTLLVAVEHMQTWLPGQLVGAAFTAHYKPIPMLMITVAIRVRAAAVCLLLLNLLMHVQIWLSSMQPFCTVYICYHLCSTVDHGLCSRM